MKRIRLGVAGLGRIGLVHATNLAGRIASAELVRAVDADEALASSVAARLNVDWSTSFESLLADPNVDAVVRRRRLRSTRS